MFVILVSYRKSLEEVERHLAAHRAFLDRHFAAGDLVCTGPQQPRTGGVILSRASDRAAVDSFISEDPFYVHGIADYAVTEFTPTKCCEGFDCYL